MNKIYSLLFLLVVSLPAFCDTIPSGFRLNPEWNLGFEATPGTVIHTNDFLKGKNQYDSEVNSTLGIDLRAGFRYNPSSREGIIYKGLYQGIGVASNLFFSPKPLGSPVSVYVYQGAPITHLSKNFWLGYEWQFGAAFGWRHNNDQDPHNNALVSTAVTAHMGLGLGFTYQLNKKCQLSFGLDVQHYSNGNTSWPNGGVNTVGAKVGIAYILNPQEDQQIDGRTLEQEADRKKWNYDITVFGAYRKRVVKLQNTEDPQICPGKFGILGLQFSPLRKLNRWVAVGPALNIQWDESAGLAPFWVEGTFGEDIKFRRPPIGKQLSVGLAAQAELTAPIFSVNAGLGFDFINPKGDKAFFQSLTLKTFITKNVYLNVGYRLGNFKHQQNLMLGFGLRL